jgi:hypothetical protein
MEARVKRWGYRDLQRLMPTIRWNGESVDFTVGGRPTGPGIIPYESLKNAGSVAATSNQIANNQQVSYLPGVYEFVDFAANGYACLWWVNVAGVRGSGIDKTVFQMRPNTSTAAGKVPAQPAPGPNPPEGTNPLWLARVGGGGTSAYPPRAVILSDFTLNGTQQGHLYNGLQLFYADGTLVQRVKVKGIPAKGSANPDETFGIGFYHGTNITIDSCEVDGRDANGNRVGSSAIGLNFTDQITVKNTYLHDGGWGAGITSYQGKSVTYTDVRVENQFAGLNFERSLGGTAVITRPVIANTPAGHIIMDSDLGNTVTTIYDPILEGKPCSPTNKLRFLVHSDYWGLPQKQLWSSIKLIINGVDRTADCMLRQTN